MKDKPITAAEWLKIPKEKRGVALAEVLTAKVDHNWLEPAVYHGHNDPLGFVIKCQQCGHVKTLAEEMDGCTVKNPIVIDWNTAMEWRDKVVAGKDSTAFATILLEVFGGGTEGDIDECFAKAQPYDYLVAAAMAQDK